MASDLSFIIKKFSEFTAEELYVILQLRAEIFVVEQQCAYQDIDGKDKNALHIIGKENKEIVAYARCFPPNFYAKEAAIGRVLIREYFRKSGYGHQLLKTAIWTVEKYYKEAKIKVSAQQHLTNFYETHGFERVGEGYLEDGIPHIGMIRE